MNTHTLSTALTSAALEFRVIEGEQRGARMVIDASKPFVVSSRLASDVVLRGAGDEDFELAVRLRFDRTRLRIWVRKGQVTVEDQVYAAGDKFDVLLYTSLRVGQCVVALGRPDNPAWRDLPTMRNGDPQGFEDSELSEFLGIQDSLLGHPQPRSTPVPPKSTAWGWPRRLLLGGATLMCASFGALVFAYSVTPQGVAAAPLARQLQTSLQDAGFARLSVQPSADGQQVVVSGYLDTATQRAEVERVLSQQPLQGRMAVWVNEAVVHAVQDVFRVNGMEATAEATGAGAVLVRTRTSDLGALSRIQAVASRDVPGLAELRVENDPPPEAAPAMRYADDPGKRIASIVPGEMPYVVTADGTRYFEGALLPTGHRLVSIHEREVMLEMNGVPTPLRF